MARNKRKVLLIAGLIIFISLAAWLYYHLYLSTGSALQRAEAFLFRRMTVGQLGESGSYRYFYATNRHQQTQNDNADEDIENLVEQRYGTEREEQLKFGRFDIEIEPSLGLGMLINPTEWFQNEEIRLRSLKTLEQQAFVEQVRRLVDESPRRSLLVVIHGFREAYPSALRKTAFLGHVLDINSPIMLFDWPGDQGSSLAGYRRARGIAKESGAELAKALTLVINEIQPDKLWLIANSMGGQVVADAFSILYQDAELADKQTEIEHVVLTAPDVDSTQFDEQFKREITALARNLTVYVSSNDRALVMSRIINRGARRGESTLSPDQLDEAVRLSELIDPEDKLITLVDVTPVNRTRNFHNFSLETPEFFDDLFLRLTNSETPQSRLVYQIKTVDGVWYSVLTQGR